MEQVRQVLQVEEEALQLMYCKVLERPKNSRLRNNKLSGLLKKTK